MSQFNTATAKHLSGARNKFIHEYDMAELDAAVKEADDVWGPVFWTLLKGVDAYQERRKRTLKTHHDPHAILKEAFDKHLQQYEHKEL